MGSLFKRLFLRLNWRLAIAALGYLASEWDLQGYTEPQRQMLRDACLMVALGSLGVWAQQAGQRIPRKPRDKG